MKYYAYIGNHKLGQEPCGCAGKIMINREFKTDRGAVRSAIRGGAKEFRIFKYTNVYDNKTFREVTWRP